MLLFDLDPASRLGATLAADLDAEVSPHEHRRFEDGEGKVRPLHDPRGEDVYVVQSLHGGPVETPHDRLCRLLMFAATLRDHGAARVSAVVPYLAYARKDRRTQPFDPLGTRHVAQLVEAAGIDQLFVLEPHDLAAFENAYRIPVVALAAHHAFDAWLAARPAPSRLAVASPDPGGVKRAQRWREHVEARRGHPVGFAFVDKRRAGGVMSGGQHVAGDVQDATVLLVDDLVATGHTLVQAARALRAHGARTILACAAHGLFVSGADEVLGDEAIDRVAVCDGLPPFRVRAGSPLSGKLDVVPCGGLFSDALRDSHAAWRR